MNHFKVGDYVIFKPGNDASGLVNGIDGWNVFGYYLKDGRFCAFSVNRVTANLELRAPDGPEIVARAEDFVFLRANVVDNLLPT